MKPAPPAQESRTLAARLAARIGADPLGPIAERLKARCRGMDERMLAKAFACLLEPGLPPPIRPLIDAASNRETYFFRDPKQLSVLEGALAAWNLERSRHVRLWSAGCASGEEAWSLAVIARRALPAGAKFSVLATDVSEAAISEARRGVYRTGPMSPCRSIEVETADWLEPADGGKVSVVDGLRRMVTFDVGNLLDGPPEGQAFDAIVCRNVLLYMTAEARRAALEVLARAAAPDGLLLLGPGDIAEDANPVDAGFDAVDIDCLPLFRKRSR